MNGDNNEDVIFSLIMVIAMLLTWPVMMIMTMMVMMRMATKMMMLNLIRQ